MKRLIVRLLNGLASRIDDATQRRLEAQVRARLRKAGPPEQLGCLLGYRSFRSGPVPSAETVFTGDFWVPVDSWIDISVWHGIRTDTLNGTGWARYRLELDGELRGDFELSYDEGHVRQTREIRNLSVTAGRHTVKVARYFMNGAPAVFFDGGGGVTVT